MPLPAMIMLAECMFNINLASDNPKTFSETCSREYWCNIATLGYEHAHGSHKQFGSLFLYRSSLRILWMHVSFLRNEAQWFGPF